jgi:hypothetical protein
MLTPTEIAEHLATLSYKPGWSWTLDHDTWEGPFIRFLIDVPDAYDASKTITLGVNTWLPPMVSTEALDLFMAWRIARIENHEAREMLQRDGRPIFDPHADDTPTEKHPPKDHCKALTDAISGQLGARVLSRSFVPGNGSAVSY